MERITADEFRYMQRHQFAPGANSFVSLTSQPFQPHPTKAMNPNKAIFTIDANTGQILIVNNNACLLLGYTSSELRNKDFFDLLPSKSKHHVSALAEVEFNSQDGTMILLSGKVVEMTTKQNTKLAVSLWIRQIDSEGRCLAVAEPVERRVCHVEISQYGSVVYADSETLTIFQYESLDQLIGLDIYSMIPAIKLPDPKCQTIPKNLRKQKATGKTTDGMAFPLCLILSKSEESTDSSTESSCCVPDATSSLELTISVFQNLSGLVVVDEYGKIKSCNPHFSHLMFGYVQDRMQNLSITKLIPTLGRDDRESRDLTNSSLSFDKWEAEIDPVLRDLKIATPIGDEAAFATSVSVREPFKNTSDCLFVLNDRSRLMKPGISLLKIQSTQELDSNSLLLEDVTTPINANFEFPFGAPLTKQHTIFTSMPSNLNKSISATSIESNVINNTASQKIFSWSDGRYKGEAVHADGNIIDIMYSVTKQKLPCGRPIYCFWICRDPDTVLEPDNEKHPNLTLTFNSITSTVEHSLGQVIKSTAAQNSSCPNSASHTQYDDDQVSGDFNKYYTILKQIGKGAYGYVKMAYRNSDRLLVITKFILKEKLCSHFMMIGEDKQEIPMEIYILKTIKHPNIVSVLDVFENDHFFQLVMEKHGSGMDLFEFIERRPLMDERLCSYIFRQIAGAVFYLHENKILHRDIKDENIIIDQNFEIKLIDFGSATFMEEGKYFSTFFGTTEYCSPEVLAGNKYAGPELEMWALGVTLYVLTFFENPFIDVEETLRRDLFIPRKVSAPLEALLRSMLNKDPACRCTMKQLISCAWLNQDVNPSTFDFAWVVPCEPHEANPDKYFTGQLYSSATALSTISLQESLSLVDEGFALDNTDVDRNEADNVSPTDSYTLAKHIYQVSDSELDEDDPNNMESKSA